jgi:hypothetical protein
MWQFPRIPPTTNASRAVDRNLRVSSDFGDIDKMVRLSREARLPAMSAETSPRQQSIPTCPTFNMVPPDQSMWGYTHPLVVFYAI